MAFVRLDPSILPDITGNCIDYKYYMNSPVRSQSVIEAIVVKKPIGKLLDNKKTLYTIAPNPDNPQKDHFNFRNQYAMTKQPHADFRTNVFCVETYNNKNIFFDVKLRGNPVSSVPLLTGYLSLTQHLNDNVLINRHKHEISTCLKKLSTISNDERNHLKQVQDDLNVLLKSPKEQMSAYYNVLGNTDLNVKITSIVNSRVVLADNNTILMIFI